MGNFLTTSADALHQNGKKLGVDAATWNIIWDVELLNASTVDKILWMSTYTGNFSVWQTVFSQAVNSISPNKLGIGLETVNDMDNNRPYTIAEIVERFHLIIAEDVEELAFWKMPIPDNFWPFIENFLKQ